MDIIKEVKKLNLPEGKYAVFGSGPLHIHRIRESQDIDILTTEEVYESLRETGEWREVIKPNGIKALQKGEYDILYFWFSDNYDPDTKMLIETAEIIDGIPFVKLNEVLKWKITEVRQKDKDDVELIKSYLNNKKQEGAMGQR